MIIQTSKLFTRKREFRFRGILKASIIISISNLVFAVPSEAQSVPEGFEVLVAASNLDGDAVAFATLPDERILVVNQFSGSVKVIVNGALRTEALLIIPNLVTSSEKGLLGITVDPDYPSEPYVYVFHSHQAGTGALSNRVSRFTVSGDLGDPNSDNLEIDVGSQLTLIDDMPAQATNHNGGTVRFGSDKTLYISHGDDANRSLVQNLATLNGKILRLNRDGSIPPDNPVFPNEPPNKRDEIFAFGLRNPFRFAIDPLTDELFIGDVGQDARESFDLSSSGENFGWPRFEGSFQFDPNAPLIEPFPTFPIWEYSHVSGLYSAIALAAYRQVDFPVDASFPDEYEGTYFYADYYHDWIRNLRMNGGGFTSVDFAADFTSPVDGTVGSDGSLLVLEYGNSIKKIIFTQPVQLIINEVVTDPQQDWSDSGGGNGVPFDDVPGSGTITDSDEWVELFNLGTEAIDLTEGEGWTLELNDTTPDTLNFASPGGTVEFVFSNGGSLSNFLPGEYLVIGNSPGSANNDIFLVLKNSSGTVVDDVELGDDPEGDGVGDGAPDGGPGGGDATGIADEAVARVPNAVDTDNDVDDFAQQAATIGASNDVVSGEVTATVVCPSNFVANCPITVAVTIDVSATVPPQLLGSYSARLNWDPALLSYVGFSGGDPPFDNPVVDEVNVGIGELSIAQADVSGAGGAVNVINVELDVIGEPQVGGILDLGFSELTAAGTLIDLLPVTTIADCSFEIAPGCLLGDIIDDDGPTIFDALIVASYSVGLEIPPDALARINQGCGNVSRPVDGDEDTNVFDALLIATFAVSLPVDPYPVGEPFCSQML